MPTITSAPKAHSLIQLEAVRQQLAEAAELAADANGVVDTSKVADPTLRDAFEKIADGKLFSAVAFANRLDALLDAIDRADTGGSSSKAHYFGYGGLRGIENDAKARHEKHTPPLLSRIAAMLGGPSPNFTLDLEERANIGHHPAVGAVLAKADSESNTKSEALAKQHFTGDQQLDRNWVAIDPNAPEWREDNVRPEAFLRGAAGSLKDIDVVMVKHRDSGSWSSAQVEKDGSYNLPLGDKDGEISVWYQKSGGEKFFGGNAMIRGNGTEMLGRLNWVATPSENMERPPLGYVR